MRKKIACALALLPFLLMVCGRQKSVVERLKENGVEVVINHARSADAAPREIKLEREFAIDFASDEAARIGLAEATVVAVDSEGNIYMGNQGESEDFIYKFDRDGKFVASFGRKGQGPGEIQFLVGLGINDRDEIVVTDQGQMKILFIDKAGGLLRQQQITSAAVSFMPLRNGDFIIAHRAEAGQDFRSFTYDVCGPDFKTIKEIGRHRYFVPSAEKDFLAINPTAFVAVSRDRIFVADSESGYEIKAFDHAGNVKKIIRKDYTPVAMPEKFKKDRLEQFSRAPASVRSHMVFPAELPPFQTAFVDESDWLFVMTYEETGKPKEFWYDVFDESGAFAARMKLDNYGQSGNSAGFLFVMAKGGRIYHFRQKEDGFKELVVSRID